MIGDSIAHYRISGKLGEGGMGTVYQATDTKLTREVAIKILPPEFATDPDRMARFTREAQVLASLNHPNIAAIYGVEDRAIVMELVGGETLADVLEHGPIACAEAILYARQIADALEAAHEKGIVHRDLKPANIKLTASGQIKVLDFGLAKLAGPEAPEPVSAQSATRKHSPTVAGVIMGTAGYMAPEQARGTAVDKRADIWAWGILLFEMLSGKRAFQGETISDQLASVLKTDVDLTQLPPATPGAVRKLLRRCLERDRNRRLRDIADARMELESMEPDAPPVLAPVAQNKSPRLWMVIAAVASLAAAGLLAERILRAPKPVAPLRFDIVPPGNLDFGPIREGGPVVAPDGSAVVFRASDDNLWVRLFTASEATMIPGSRSATYPFWSPDARSIAFFSEAKLKRSSISGGPPQVICDAPAGRGGAWIGGNSDTDSTILFAPFNEGLLYRVSPSGGKPVVVTADDPAIAVEHHRMPAFLGDGRQFLYYDRGVISVASLDGGPGKRLLDGIAPQYAPPGHIMFVRDNALLAQGLDEDKLQLQGEPFPIGSNVSTHELRGSGDFSVSRNGVLAWRESANRRYELYITDRQGKPAERFPGIEYLARPVVSPDGTEVMLIETADIQSSGRIWILNLQSKLAIPLHDKKVAVVGATWTPDGSHLTYTQAPHPIETLEVGASKPAQELIPYGNNRVPADWTHDGSHLLFSEQHGETGMDVWAVAKEGERKPAPLLKGLANEGRPRLSFDDHWLAYHSDESGQQEIYVTAYVPSNPPSTKGKWRISPAQGSTPFWRRDGRELFYVRPNADGSLTLMAASVSAAGGNFQAGQPVPLFDLPAGSSIDVLPDGQRFLVSKTLQEPVRPLHVTMNWMEMLRRRATAAQGPAN